MSAIVCGKRSNFFEDLQSSSPSSPPPASKRIRCSSSSPVRLSPPRSATASNLFSAGSYSSSAAIDHLVAHFPEMDKQFLERALEECGNDLDSAIKSLTELRLSSVENLAHVGRDRTDEVNIEHSDQGNLVNNDHSAPVNPSTEGAEWVDLFVREMVSASNIDDAKARASRALEALERSIQARATVEANQEIVILKQQLQALMHENSVLKRAVAIQHERQKEYEDRSQELDLLKQRLAQYQEQLKTLEVNNFALAMHLKAAQQGSSIPGRFHPDVF